MQGPARLHKSLAILTIHFVRRRDIGAIHTIPKKRLLAAARCSSCDACNGDGRSSSGEPVAVIERGLEAAGLRVCTENLIRID
jgi:hypothetical protein